MLQLDLPSVMVFRDGVFRNVAMKLDRRVGRDQGTLSTTAYNRR
jgi:hypothetical protein